MAVIMIWLSISILLQQDLLSRALQYKMEPRQFIIEMYMVVGFTVKMQDFISTDVEYEVVMQLLNTVVVHMEEVYMQKM
jgi:hypothetical protein